VSEEERDVLVDGALTDAGQTQPPEGLVRSIMAEVSAEESRFTAWRRWRRAARGRRLTNFLAAGRVSSRHGGVVVRNKILWTVAGLGAVVLVSVFVFGYPPIGSGTEATIGVAQRYQGNQISAKDINVPDSDVQQFIQSETFDRLLKDKVTRNALVALFSNEVLAEAVSKRRMVEALALPAVRAAIANRAFQEAMQVEGVAAILADRQFAENVAKSGVADAIAKHKAMVEALGKGKAAEALLRREVVEALSMNQVAEALAMEGVSEALSRRGVLEALANASMAEAFGRSNFVEALEMEAMHKALSMNASRMAISAALAR
jgi:hypothetical protein